MNFRPPIEPTSDARQAALALRGYYLALIETGFSEEEALIIVLKVLEKS